MSRDQRQQVRPRCFVCGAEAEQERVLVTVNTAKRLCRVSRSTIYRWMRENLVDWVELPLGSRRIYLDSLFVDRPYQPDYLD